MAARAKPPPLTSGDTLHWDGGDAIAPGVALTQGSEPGACAVLPVHRQLATGGQPLPCVQTRPLGLLLSRPVPAIDWARAAASVTFYLEPRLLLPPPVHAMLPGVTGTLLWGHGRGMRSPSPPWCTRRCWCRPPRPRLRERTSSWCCTCPSTIPSCTTSPRCCSRLSPPRAWPIGCMRKPWPTHWQTTSCDAMRRAGNPRGCSLAGFPC